MTRSSVFVIGSYGRGNIGDDTFLLAISQLIKNHNIIINASDDADLPDNVRKRVKTVSTKLNNDLRKKILYFRQSDYVIYGGGDLWVDLHKDRLKRKSLWKMIIVNLITRLSGKKLLYISTGAGELSGFSLVLAKLSASMANKIVYRDERSRSIIGIDGLVLSDITCILASNNPKPVYVNKLKKIGFSVTYNIDNPEVNFDMIIDNLVEFVSNLKQKPKIIIYPMLISKSLPKDDLWASKQLKSRLRGYDIEIYMERDPLKLMVSMKSLDIILSMRLHGSILALWVQTACIGIAYRSKVKGFFREHVDEKLAVEFNDISRIKSIVGEVDSGKYSEKYKRGVERGLKSKKAYEAIFAEI